MADVIPLRVRRDSVLCFARLKDTRTCPQRDLCNVGVRYHLAANTSRASTVLTFKKAQAHTTGIMEATTRHLSLARYALPVVLNAPSESAPPPLDIEPRRIIPKSVGGYYDGIGSDSETLGHGLHYCEAEVICKRSMTTLAEWNLHRAELELYFHEFDTRTVAPSNSDVEA